MAGLSWLTHLAWLRWSSHPEPIPNVVLPLVAEVCDEGFLHILNGNNQLVWMRPLDHHDSGSPPQPPRTPSPTATSRRFRPRQSPEPFPSPAPLTDLRGSQPGQGRVCHSCLQVRYQALRRIWTGGHSSDQGQVVVAQLQLLCRLGSKQG
ncbi:hypothetical protein BDZ88DRAFT_49074 [Geranomyces variabilis]|nr:hypothetical protein BDZ88DRAFT_49074 [Geranomyces variabilis]